MPNVDVKKTSLDPKVPCADCMNEIPKSEAFSPEGNDYALFFCGLECYEAWRRKAVRPGEGIGGAE